MRVSKLNQEVKKTGKDSAINACLPTTHTFAQEDKQRDKQQFNLPHINHYIHLTLKLAGYFAKHIHQGGFVELPPPKNFETANNWHMPFGMQLVHDLLINLHSNNHHLISRCCHGNKTKNPRWLPFLKFCLLLRDFVGNS